ncbi:MAG: hypothetical protein V3T05_05675 [Myxococcota bacterium]
MDDTHVWPVTGRKAPNTADGLTRGEVGKLGKLAETNPKEFFQRLLADSSNGTPVSYEHTFKAGRAGEVHVDIEVKDGELEAKVTFEIYKKVVRKSSISDFFVDKKLPGERPGVSLTTTGKLQKDGSITGLKVALDIQNLPALSADALAGKPEAISELKEALEARGRRSRSAGVMDAIESLFDSPERFLPLILADIADDSDSVKFSITPEKTAWRLKGLIGGGSFKVNVRHLLSGRTHDADDLDVKATIKGKVENWGKTIVLDKVRLETTQDITAKFSDGADLDDAELFVGDQELRNSAVQEIAMMAFFALAALNDNGF